MIIAPTIEPISNVPVVKTRRSQLGSVADNMPDEELLLLEVDLAVEEEAVVLVLMLVLVVLVLALALKPVIVADALMVSMTDPVIKAPLPMVEVVEQEDDLGMG